MFRRFGTPGVDVFASRGSAVITIWSAKMQLQMQIGMGLPTTSDDTSSNPPPEYSRGNIHGRSTQLEEGTLGTGPKEKSNEPAISNTGPEIESHRPPNESLTTERR